MVAQVKVISGKSMKMQLLGVLLAALFISFLLGSVIVKAGGKETFNNEKQYFTNVTVAQGDTLWDIAKAHLDQSHYSSIYQYMEELREMNNLTSDDLYTGQNMLVTYYAESPVN